MRRFDLSLIGYKNLWLKKKMLASRIFSFPCCVFKRHLLRVIKASHCTVIGQHMDFLVNSQEQLSFFEAPQIRVLIFPDRDQGIKGKQQNTVG